ncbi:MAG: flagellar basal body rod protein FlgB [Aestuariivirga sp.]|uniref:flagellar basal body protein n=1 Tax=Aestuariivirga sp. TaxID=2650926 RepID=UPI0025BBC298|nr:flagellar basal body protein [Aestuariivirga sp.]MCA3561417.1 flagellar basal body rod protein FlgB [Aestuariivirga sp.]
MYLFDLASRHMTWLSERQAVTASNIANADTPGYRAQGVGSFSAYLDGPSVQMAATSPLHMMLPPDEARSAGRDAGKSWASSHSGNNVSVEQELMTASSSNRMMGIDAGLVRSFHRMLLASVKA